MLGNLSGWHLVIIAVVFLLLFGAAKLPALARSVGQSARIFKDEMKSMKDDETLTVAAAADPTLTVIGPQPQTKP